MNEKTRKTIRTAVQTAVGLAASLPVLLPALGVPETAAGVGVVLAVSATVTRVMHMDAARPLLRWLGLDVEGNPDGGGR